MEKSQGGNGIMKKKYALYKIWIPIGIICIFYYIYKMINKYINHLIAKTDGDLESLEAVLQAKNTIFDIIIILAPILCIIILWGFIQLIIDSKS